MVNNYLKNNKKEQARSDDNDNDGDNDGNTNQSTTKKPEKVSLQQPVMISDRLIENNYLPERRYVGSNDFSFRSFQTGFIYNNEGRFPIYESRRGRNFYYHVVDNQRSQIRIPIETPKNEQIYDQQELVVPELSPQPFTVKLYDYAGGKYIPF